jgi:hypothetical protein
VQAVRRAEGNRRPGGIKTQNSVVKDFEVKHVFPLVLLSRSHSFLLRNGKRWRLSRGK